MTGKQFERTRRLLGDENTELLGSKTIAIAGIGAVGGYALEALARIGIGHFILVDFDRVSESNINRQILALHSTICDLKTDAAERRVMDINPECTIDKHPVVISSDNLGIFSSADIILDCIDSVKSKVALVRSCQKSGTTLMSSMGAALRRDLGAVRVAPLSKTSGCPLARSVRRLVRKEGLRDDYLTVYSPEPVVFDYSRENEEREDERVKPTLGSMMTVTALFGLSLAHEAIRHIVGPEDFLALH